MWQFVAAINLLIGFKFNHVISRVLNGPISNELDSFHDRSFIFNTVRFVFVKNFRHGVQAHVHVRLS